MNRILTIFASIVVQLLNECHSHSSTRSVTFQSTVKNDSLPNDRSIVVKVPSILPCPCDWRMSDFFNVWLIWQRGQRAASTSPRRSTWWAWRKAGGHRTGVVWRTTSTWWWVLAVFFLFPLRRLWLPGWFRVLLCSLWLYQSLAAYAPDCADFIAVILSNFPKNAVFIHSSILIGNSATFHEKNRSFEKHAFGAWHKWRERGWGQVSGKRGFPPNLKSLDAFDFLNVIWKIITITKY